MAAYATVDEYRLDTGDADTSDERVQAVLDQQSAKLRAKLGISADRALTDDQGVLARLLVTDAARKALVAPSINGVDDVSGVKTTSFSANGFQSSYTLANPSGVAYFDNDTLKALRRLLGSSQRIGTIMPSYGRLR